MPMRQLRVEYKEFEAKNQLYNRYGFYLTLFLLIKQLLGPEICIYNAWFWHNAWMPFFVYSVFIKSMKVHKNTELFGANSHNMNYAFII